MDHLTVKIFVCRTPSIVPLSKIVVYDLSTKRKERKKKKRKVKKS